ncbi:MAG: hypothetical protein HOO86_02280 [Bacteroidales bacterium]|nr:hypothetical protein [Bacteroidales bacterium]
MKTKIGFRFVRPCLIAGLILFSVIDNQLSAQIFKPKQQSTPKQTETVSKPQRSETATTNSYSRWSNDWRITLGGGTSLFFGDIKQYTFYPVFKNKSEWRFGASLLIEKQLSPVFSLRGQALLNHLVGTRRSWDRNFIAENIEFNLNTAIDINNLLGRDRKDRFFTTSLIFGVGLANFNSTLYALGSGNVLATNGFGNGSGLGGRTLEGILMAGASFDFRLDDNWSLRLESANRIMNSDYLDLYSSHFKYDVYNYTSVGISYTFNSAKKRVSKVPEGEPVNIPEVIQNEPVSPEESLNQVVDVLKVDETNKAAEPEKQVVETTPEVIVVPVKNEVAVLDTEYRVQIRARYEGKVSIADLSRKYNIPENEISESNHNRYYIYTVGSFATYEQAAQKRNEIRSVNKVYDAFIVAFKDGIRLDKLPK